MKFSVIALFAAGAMASVIPEHPEEGGSYPEPTSAPEVSTEDSSPTKSKDISTVYETNIHTITDCEDTVTDCPIDATKTLTEIITSTYCPDDESEYPEPTKSHEESEYPEPTSTDDESPEPTVSVCVPETKVKTITTEYTTVVPTTILETYTEDCPEPTGDYPVKPTPSGGFGNNGTIPQPTGQPPVEAGAASVAGSVFTAAVAGLVAFAFA